MRLDRFMGELWRSRQRRPNEVGGVTDSRRMGFLHEPPQQALSGDRVVEFAQQILQPFQSMRFSG